MLTVICNHYGIPFIFCHCLPFSFVKTLKVIFNFLLCLFVALGLTETCSFASSTWLQRSTAFLVILRLFIGLAWLACSKFISKLLNAGTELLIEQLQLSLRQRVLQNAHFLNLLSEHLSQPFLCMLIDLVLVSELFNQNGSELFTFGEFL